MSLRWARWVYAGGGVTMACVTVYAITRGWWWMALCGGVGTLICVMLQMIHEDW